MNPTKVLQDSFDNAADAIVSGNIETLKSLLQKAPQLATTLSERDFHENLLHYVAANGVPDKMQHTPDNIVEIAKVLLEAGANPNMIADGVYDGESGSTALVCLVSSIHPAKAGKQGELVKIFCQYGAKVNGIENDAYPLKTAIDTRFPEAIHALVNCNARVDNIIFAAALGDLDKVKAFLQEVPETYTDAFHNVLNKSDSIKSRALCAAAMVGHHETVAYLLEQGVALNASVSVTHGTVLHEATIMNRVNIVRYLLENGADVSAQDKQGFTALHWSAWHGHLEITELLLNYDAPLEIKNIYGGTVIDSAVFGFTQASPYPSANQLNTLQKLIDAGADVSKITPFPTGNENIDSFLKPYMTGN